jgi:LemA protein
MIIILVFIVIIAIWAISAYNGLIGKKNNVESAFSGIDIQLKKRWDLIPNLVAAVKEYMSHERGILEKITELRSQVMQSSGEQERFGLENQISSMLGQLKVAVEAYPDLKANTNVMKLQQSLNEVEAQISATRRTYNAEVKSLNNAVEKFPSNIMANMMKMETREFFEIPREERENVDVGDLFAK